MWIGQSSGTVYCEDSVGMKLAARQTRFVGLPNNIRGRFRVGNLLINSTRLRLQGNVAWVSVGRIFGMLDGPLFPLAEGRLWKLTTFKPEK